MILLAYAFVVRSVIFMNRLPAQTTTGSRGYLYDLVFAQAGTWGFWSFALSTLCVWVQAMMINHLVIKHKISDKKTWLPGLMYVFASSFMPMMLYLSAPMVANFFLIPAISQLFSTYRIQECRKAIFNVGFFLGLAALVFPKTMLLALPIYLAFSSLRSFRLVEQIGFVVGILTSYFMVGALAFLTDQFDLFWNLQFTKLLALPALDFKMQLSTIVGLVFWAGLLIAVLFSATRFYARKGLQVQKYNSILYWLLFAGIGLLFLQNPMRVDTLYLAVPSIAVFMGLFLEEMKNRPVAELLHLICLVVLFLSQYLLILS